VLNYPTPNGNPVCRCTNSAQAFFCATGHLTECHWPYDCRSAGCSHLARYVCSPEEVELLERVACERLRDGSLPPYRLDRNGVVEVNTEAVRTEGPGTTPPHP